LGEKKPVALQQSKCIFIFQDHGVDRYPLDVDPDVFPEDTWALCDSNRQNPHPCSAFLEAAQQLQAWIVQTTSPMEERWKGWFKHRAADLFIMNCYSFNEIRALR
jgi:hypothetical protein